MQNVSYGSHQMLYDQQEPSTSGLQQPMTPMSQCYSMPPGTPLTPKMSMSRPHTPQTPTRYTYPNSAYPSRSGTPSDPLQKLRQGYANARSQQMNQWMTDQYCVQGMPQYNSRAPSVMSNMSGVSQMSCMSNTSVMSNLSVCTTLTEAVHVNQMAPQFHSASSTSSATENIDPTFLNQLDVLLDNIIANFNCPDVDFRRKVINTILIYAKEKKFKYAINAKLHDILVLILRTIADPHAEAELLKQMLQSLYHMTSCGNCVNVMSAILKESRGALIHVIVSRLVPNQIFTPSAVITLLSLFSKEEPHGSQFRRCARSDVTVIRLIALLSSQLTHNVKNLVVDCARHVMVRSPKLKRCFVENDGMAILLSFLTNETDERVLYSTVRTLYTFINNTENNPFAEKFVKQLDGVNILASLLSHGSSRLLHEILKCMATASNYKVIGEVDLRTTIQNLLMLMGAHDPMIANYSTSFLVNVSASGDGHKRALVDARCPGTLIAIVMSKDTYFEFSQLPNIRQLVDSIQSNALITLANLLRGKECGRDAAVQVNERSSDSAKVLLNIIASGNIHCKYNAIVSICGTIEYVPTFMNLFLAIFDDAKQQTLSTTLLSLIWDAFKKFEQTSDPLLRSKFIKLVESIVRLCVHLLRSPQLAEQIVTILRTKNPVPLLHLVKDLNMHNVLLNLLERVSATDGTVVREWMSDRESAQTLEMASQHEKVQISAAAGKIIEYYIKTEPVPCFDPTSMDFAGPIGDGFPY